MAAAALEAHRTTASGRFYPPELDSLRFFAFLTVFVSHVCLFTGAQFVQRLGSHGVDLFFALSAYLLTELMLREKECSPNGSLNVRAFYIRRALRIWPLYFAFLSTMFLFWSIYGIDGIPGHAFAVYAVGLADLPITGATSMAIVSLWSISLEEQVYLVWPNLVRRLSRERIAQAGVALWLGCVIIRLMVFVTGTGVDSLVVLSHLDSVFCGIVVVGLRKSKLPPIVLLCLGIAAWFGGSLYVYVPNPGPVLMTLAFVAVGVGSGALLLSVLRVAWLRNSVTVYLGRISYGLYVFHGAALVIALSLCGPEPSAFVLALLLTIVVAACSYRWLESPFLRMKRRFQYIASEPIA